MRSRGAGVPENTLADILWHGAKSMTQHYAWLRSSNCMLHSKRSETTTAGGTGALHAAKGTRGLDCGDESPKSPPAKKRLNAKALKPFIQMS